MQKVIFKKLPVCEPSKFMKITKNKKPTNTNHKKIICKSTIETIFPWLMIMMIGPYTLYKRRAPTITIKIVLVLIGNYGKK